MDEGGETLIRSNDEIREQLYGLIAEYADQNHGYRFDPENPQNPFA